MAKRGGIRRLGAVLLLALALWTAGGFLSSRGALTVRRWEVPLPRLTAPVRVAVLSDLHDAEFRRDLAEQVAAEALSRAEAEIPPEIHRNAARTAALQFRQAAPFSQIYGELSARGLRPLVVKGAVCRALYPRPELRPSADEDLLCPPEDFPALLEALEQMGFAVFLPEDDPVAACRQRETGLYLEVHRTLFPPDSRAYGGLNRFFDGAFDRSTEAAAEGCVLRTLCPQDHLLYLILHSFKHFLHSGFGIRQVCDICLFAAAYGDETDWPDLTATLREVRADVFAANLLDIGRRRVELLKKYNILP